MEKCVANRCEEYARSSGVGLYDDDAITIVAVVVGRGLVSYLLMLCA